MICIIKSIIPQVRHILTISLNHVFSATWSFDHFFFKKKNPWLEPLKTKSPPTDPSPDLFLDFVLDGRNHYFFKWSNYLLAKIKLNCFVTNEIGVLTERSSLEDILLPTYMLAIKNWVLYTVWHDLRFWHNWFAKFAAIFVKLTQISLPNITRTTEFQPITQP